MSTNDTRDRYLVELGLAEGGHPDDYRVHPNLVDDYHELVVAIQCHNLRVTVAQARKAQLDSPVE